MKSHKKVIKNTEITLVLNKIEAFWLKDFIQNHPNPHLEDESFKKIRIELFEALGDWNDLED